MNLAIVTTLLLLLAADSALLMTPNFSVQATTTMSTYPFVGAVPNPAAVGEKVLIHYGITEGLGASNLGWTGITVTVTDPSGHNETLGPFTTDSTGGSFTFYTPIMTGTYYLQSHFPQQVNPVNIGFGGNPWVPAGAIMLASDSSVLALNVTQEGKPQTPYNPLPTEYWTTPIDAQSQAWYSISGNWFEIPQHFNALYNDYAPQSPHILWAKQLATGGLAGGLLGGIPASMETGDAYEGFFAGNSGGQTGVVILNGKLYYNDYSLRGTGTTVPQNVVCVDLKTGQQVWNLNLNNTRLEFGQSYYWNSYNYQGTYDLLWTFSNSGSTWNAYDALTGKWQYSMTNMPTSNPVSRLRGPNGEIIIYYVDLAHGWMMKWNSSYVVNPAGGSFSGQGAGFTGKTYNCSMNGYQSLLNRGGWMWNKTIPASSSGIMQSPIFTDDSMYFTSNNIIAGSINNGAFLGAPTTNNANPTTTTVWAISLKTGQEGTLLFNTTWQNPTEWAGNLTIAWRDASKVDGIAVLMSKELHQFYGISLDTGKLAWGPTPSTESYLDYLGNSQLTASAIAYGNLYNAGVGGIVHCYDVKTGNLLWEYAVNTNYADETEISNNWWVGIMFFADGMIYLGHGEHSPNQPMPPNAPFLALNATTGQLVWRINGAFQESGWGGNAVIGDSTIVTQDEYTQNIYAIGKGPSAITATIQNDALTQGANVIIKGFVTDTSPGTSAYALTARFPNGVPAVSDDSQNQWMLYVYKQMQRPTNTTGVPVTLSVVDSNGNYRIIGTATSDSDGFYSFSWTPDIQGQYTVYATFAGSNSYYPSHAVNSFEVTPPAATATPQPTATPSAADLYFVPAIIGVIIAIIVVGIGLALLVTKKP